MKRFPAPRKSSIAEIEEEATFARSLYANQRPQEGRDAYRYAHAEALADVAELFDVSEDLLSLRAVLPMRPALLDVARYLDAPPISADDLETVSGFVKSSAAAPAVAARTTVIAAGLDPDRFPWLFETPVRPPEPDERTSAIRVTAALIASQRAATVLRNRWAARQEESVADILSANGYTAAPRRRIDSLADLPAGSFRPE
ncbi:MAG TPA: XamI family restriction endonuclease, partial [Desulfobacterales bacterium]|nr:XamI family restriction endonuclease [Desulfobacterales bacterium]